MARGVFVQGFCPGVYVRGVFVRGFCPDTRKNIMHALRSLQIGQNFQLFAVLSNTVDIAEFSRMLRMLLRLFLKKLLQYCRSYNLLLKWQSFL